MAFAKSIVKLLPISLIAMSLAWPMQRVSAAEKPSAIRLFNPGEPGCDRGAPYLGCGANADKWSWGQSSASNNRLSGVSIGGQSITRYDAYMRLVNSTSQGKWLCGALISDPQNRGFFKAIIYNVDLTLAPLLVSDPSDCICSKNGRAYIGGGGGQIDPGNIQPRPRPRL